MHSAHGRLAVFLGWTLIGAGCTDEFTGPGTGSIQVALTTTGDDLDPDGYSLVLGEGRQFSLGLNSSIPITELAPGQYTLRLERLASNCQAAENPRTVTVVSGQTVSVAFTVSCVSTTGSIRVRTVSSGAIPDGHRYTVYVDLPSGAPGSETIGPNDSMTFSRVPAVTAVVRIEQEPRNCLVPQPARSVVVLRGQTTEVTFNVLCDLGGDLRITTTASGEDFDPGGYSVWVSSERFDTAVTIGALANLTMQNLAPVEYSVAVANVARNCQVISPNPLKVKVFTGAATDARLGVVCTRTNSRLALVSTHDGNSEISVIDVGDAAPTRITFNPASDIDPAWSPDGARLAFASSRDGNYEIYVMNVDGSNLTRLTTQIGADLQPVWSPDGARIAFESNRDGDFDIYTMTADGSDVRRLTNSFLHEVQPSWSVTDQIAFIGTSESGHRDVFSMSADGTNLRMLTDGAQEESKPTWSPDGTRIAFARNVGCSTDLGCRSDILVMNADGSAPQRFNTPFTSFTSFSDPAWSSDGTRLAFVARDCWAPSFYYEAGCSIPAITVVNLTGPGVPIALTTGIWTQSPAWR